MTITPSRLRPPPHVVRENEESKKAPECPVDKDCLRPLPIYEGSTELFQPDEAPQERSQGLKNSISRGVRGENNSQTADSEEQEPVSLEFEDNAPREEKDRLNGQETPTEGKDPEAIHEAANGSESKGERSRIEVVNQESLLNQPVKGDRVSTPNQEDNGERPMAEDENNAQTTEKPNDGPNPPPLPDFWRVTKIRLNLLKKARKLAKAEAMHKEIRSAAEREALEMRIKMRLFRESGEPSLIAEADKWAEDNF